MNDVQVLQAYSTMASKYTAILGSVDDMHELDRRCIERWSEQIDGHVIDAGCGPGHWTDFLHRRGADIPGIDFVPEFIENARIRFPDVPFQVSSLRALDIADRALGGVLAWYSLIHLPPTELPQVLSEPAVSSRHKDTYSSAFSMENLHNRLTTQLPGLITGQSSR